MCEEGLNFSPGSKIEAKDFNEKWHSARVVETDWSEGEVLVHFNESKFDEWIPMDSSRFRRHPKGLKFPDEQSNKTVFAIGVSKQDLKGKKRKSKTEIFHTGFKKAMNSDEAKKDNLNGLFYDKYNSKSEMIDNVPNSDFLINNYEECTDSLEEIKDDTYKCPMSGCNKIFRKDNLLQMHLKFYHPEYSTLFNTLPNATKLAFVKTVDESVEHFSKKPEACSSVTTNRNKVMQNFFMFHSNEHKKGTDNKGKFDVENQNKNQNNSEIVTNSIKTDKLHKDEIINCTCGYQGEDGLMIQCDLCLCWQHSYCNDIEKEEDVPEKYVCYICQNSRRQRISKKYFNEQDWIHEGKLPNISKYSTDSVETRKRVAMLKRSFDLISILLKLQNVLHSLRVKLEVACKKDHQKLYLWAKTWSKKTISLLKLDPVPVMEIMKDKTFNDDFFDGTINETLKLSKTNDSIETLIASDTELLQILEEENEDSKPKANNIVLNKSIPEPEAPINATECKRRLLEHLDNFQNYLDRILSFVEVQTSALEDMDNTEKNVDNEHGQTKQTIQMLIYDLELMKRVSAS